MTLCLGIVEAILYLFHCLLLLLERVRVLMQLLAKEQLPHILVQQILQTVLIQIVSLQLVYEATEHAGLPPLEKCKPQVNLLLAALEAIVLRLQMFDL